MSQWDGGTAVRLSDPEEVRVMTVRRDGSDRPPVTIWIVASGDRVYVRSTHGRSASWFRAAVATGTGRIGAAGQTYDVRFVEADPEELPAADAAYQAKYARYAAIVDHLIDPGPRAATLRVLPA